jgi:hypothetical protein
MGIIPAKEFVSMRISNLGDIGMTGSSCRRPSDRSGKAVAALLKIIADDETGEAPAVEVIERFGEIPEEFGESLRALSASPV